VSAFTFSVVVPAFNAQATLARAVRSALAQEPAPAEVIVVDDGSRDRTAQVAAGLDGVRVIAQENKGPSAARNHGLAEVRSPWVAFLDADDWWLPMKTSTQVSALSGRPDCALVACDWVREGTAGIVPPYGPSRGAGDSPVTEFDYRSILLLNRFQTSTVLARTEAVRSVGGFDSALDGVEDWDMWLRLAGEGRIVKVDTPLVVYRDESDGYSKNLQRVYLTMQAMLQREKGRSELPAREFDRILAWHHERFAVGFWLAGQRAHALAALAEIRDARLLGVAPSAALRYLLPFLVARVRRRLPR
jgi:glycosyltransferase involved in cell wall biosynthesis